MEQAWTLLYTLQKVSTMPQMCDYRVQKEQMDEIADMPDTAAKQEEPNHEEVRSTNGRPKSARVRHTRLTSKGGEAEELDVWKIAKAAVRGRLWTLIPGGILCGALLGFAGWKYGHQTYHSSGLVRIAFELPKVMTDTDQNSPIQMFDTFMQSQRLLIASRRVLDVAMQDPIWRTTGKAIPSDPDDYFLRHFKVDISPRSEFIQITVTDTDPGTAYAAASSVVSAYQQLYNLQEEQLEKNRIGVLDDKQKMIESDIEQMSAEILSGAQEFGSSDLDLFFDNAVERVDLAKANLERVRMQIAMTVPQAMAARSEVQASSASSPEITVDEIASVDPTMRAYLNEKRGLESDLRLMSQELGNQNAQVKEKRLQIKLKQESIDDCAKTFRMLHPGGINHDDLAGSEIGPGTSFEQLKATEASLEQMVDREQKEMIQIGNKRLKLQQMHEQLDAKKKEDDELSRRISVLRAERSLGGRLSVTSTPEIPLSPDSDQRLKYSSLGGLVGFACPLAVLLGAAFVRPGRFRFAEETGGPINSDIPMLGILPTIPSRASSYEDYTEAAHSIHQLRVTLRSKAPVDRPSSVYLVTSSTAGEGKTSLAMSLGLSLSAAGHRTLIIDCDMVGRHLTTNLKMKDRQGLKEALAAGSMRRLLHEVSPKLFALPVGQVVRGDSFSLSPATLVPLIDTMRKYFDTILIDTGPVLGSVEAAVLAQEVDGVIFVIGRDQQRPLVERALHRLTHLGAKIEGFVFNRARRDDFHSSVYASSSTRPAWDKEGTPRLPTGPIITPFEEFGPLVKSMLRGLPDQDLSLAVQHSEVGGA